jgi:tetratricopeptide (TPR) repeat protein
MLIPARPQAAGQQTFHQYVAALQNNPNDDALRQKIIALAQSMKTPPAVPADAYELVGRAAYAIKNANTDADFLAAADAYGKALQLAPWVADYYFNQGVAYEKAKHFDEAIADFNWYLTAAPNAKDANEVRERIGGLKYAKEKAGDEQRAAAARAAYESSPEGRAEKEKKDFAELLRKIDGRTYTYTQTISDSPVTLYYRIRIEGNYLIPAGYNVGLLNGPHTWQEDDRIEIQGAVTTITQDGRASRPGQTYHSVHTYVISSDGESITVTHEYTFSPGPHTNSSATYHWQR